MEGQERRYSLIIRLGTSTPTMERVREAAPKIKDYISKISGKNYKLFLTTPDGSTFGFLFKSKKHAQLIMLELTGNTEGKALPSILRNDDSMIITEVGKDFSGMGFSNGWAWIQHNH